ncbi:bacillithiol system redox-active protein YtxJ [Paenibacillus montanisoli]|uniref:Bacillithiol system redox-active protein YtxJ n=1 Tax=Paenibacillus montanisoli TaxID=2081970 RepID=A0A328UBA3_9BACL|nr:bacillithiol system redox-active protein YtxJ [Paenibacillus montanisoli]RAP78185.1 bacillithiol system redox-active protein YtxJ [Paenibacillus montanisoli]
MSQLKEIQTIEEWQAALESSSKRPLVVFKHSTTCPVSANAFTEFSNYLKNNEAASADTDFILVKVIESRPVSNQIAEDTSVKHESPQIILIKDKAKYWTASHWSITEAHMNAVMN